MTESAQDETTWGELTAVCIADLVEAAETAPCRCASCRGKLTRETCAAVLFVSWMTEHAALKPDETDQLADPHDTRARVTALENALLRQLPDGLRVEDLPLIQELVLSPLGFRDAIEVACGLPRLVG